MGYAHGKPHGNLPWDFLAMYCPGTGKILVNRVYIYIYMYIYMCIYIYIYEVGGSETNREIDFGFGSCVRARALVVRWEFGQILIAPLSLFPFLPAAFPFSLFSQRF